MGVTSSGQSQTRSFNSNARPSCACIVTRRIGWPSRLSASTWQDGVPHPHFSPHCRSAIMTGASSCPFSVNRYSILRRSHCIGWRSMIPFSTSRDSLFANMLRAMPSDDWKSSKCRMPDNAPRRMRNDQRSPIASSALGSAHCSRSCARLCFIVRLDSSKPQPLQKSDQFAPRWDFFVAQQDASRTIGPRCCVNMNLLSG